MKMTMIPASALNYTKGRGQNSIKYIVIHFTANNGDTANGNGRYFQTGGRNASAHYFVDEFGAVKSVNCGDTAWHCGAKSYRHPSCRNGNSIGIELCSRKTSDGAYFFKTETITNAVELTKEIMKAYGIPATNVIRHYDVTGKNCPAPFVRAKLANGTWLEVGTEAKSWQEFKSRL